MQKDSWLPSVTQKKIYIKLCMTTTFSRNPRAYLQNFYRIVWLMKHFMK